MSISLFSILNPGTVSAHTTQIGWVVETNCDVTFYARQYHGSVVQGGVIVDGTTYSFTATTNSPPTFDGSVQPLNNAIGSNFQIAVVSGLVTGTHALTTTAMGGNVRAGVVETPLGPPMNAFIDLDNCGVSDSADDGVLNDDDDCSDTGAGALVDPNGCSDARVDGDGDGVCDPGAPSGGPSGCTGSDDFPNSNTDSTVVIDGCDSGVENKFVSNGANFNDMIGAIISKNHGDFVKQVTQMANRWKKDGLITGREKGKITSCA